MLHCKSHYHSVLVKHHCVLFLCPDTAATASTHTRIWRHLATVSIPELLYPIMCVCAVGWGVDGGINNEDQQLIHYTHTHTHTLLQWDWSTAVVCSADIHTFIQSSHTPILQLPCHYHHIINVYHSNTLILQIYLAIFIQQICRIGQRLRNVLFSVLEICRNHFLMWMLLVRCGGADRS